jgi:hypothetical protein
MQPFSMIVTHPVVTGKNGYQLLLKMVRSLEGALQFYQVLQSARNLLWLLVL